MEKENSEFKPVKLRLKIDLVSYPVRAEGLVIMIPRSLIVKAPLSTSYVSRLKALNKRPAVGRGPHGAFSVTARSLLATISDSD